MYKILFVAVSEEMAKLTKKAINQMKLDIPIVSRTLIERQGIGKEHSDIEVFISRGRTADLLHKLTSKPIVEIVFSIDDVLNPLQDLTAKGIKKVAVISSPRLIGDNISNYKVSDAEVFMRPCLPENEEELMKQLHAQGVKGVICGNNTIEVAERYGMEAIAIDTSEVSIKRAINEAVKIVNAQVNERQRKQEKAVDIQESAFKLYDSIEQASAAVEQLAASSQQLAATSEETTRIAGNAYEEVQNVTAILDIIRHVASQSNLLGLNAAIEAARAGEYGRGFSVVAAEVRKLATESSESTKKIDSLLKKFTQRVEDVLNNVKQSNIIAQEQARANDDIANMLETLREVGQDLKTLAEINN